MADWAARKGQDTTVRNLARAMELREDPKALAALVAEAGLTREMLPSEALRSPLVWQAMIPKIPPHAMLRNLANMTRLGALGAPEQGILFTPRLEVLLGSARRPSEGVPGDLA